MTIYWTFWLWAAIPISFGIAEAYAILTNRETLSRYVWNLTSEWPPFPWFAGFATGFLVCHFFLGRHCRLCACGEMT